MNLVNAHVMNHESDLDLLLNEVFRIPTEEDTNPGRSVFQPNHLSTTSLAKISPKPNMTPLTNGSKRLIANAEPSAMSRVFVDSDESKIERVAVTSCSGG